MAMIQIGNGWYNPDLGKYTTYDPKSGQLQTFMVDVTPEQRNDFMAGVRNGTIDFNKYIKLQPGTLGGRNNVNISGQVQRAADALMQKYPQMSWESASNYANKWVMDRIQNGQDSNQIEDFAKGILRDDKNLGDEMFKGIEDMVVRDDLSARQAGDTGASLGAAANGGNPKQSIQDELRAFAGRMMSVLPPDSPQVKRIAELAQQAGNKYATQSGIGPGGITTMGVANTAARANVDLQTQREGIGAQALAAAGNQQLSVDQLNTQLQQQNQQANVMQGSNIGGMIGTGAGLIGGIVASAYGAPQALPGLMQGGGAAGQAIGGIASNNGPPISYGGGGTPTSTYKGRSWGTS